MSQSRVNLKSRDFASDAIRNVQQATQASVGAIQNLQRRAQQNKAASEKAMLIGMNTAETLQLKYSDKIGSAPAETKAALNAYVRSEAMAIGDLKAKASAPGATQEDRDAYQTKLSQSMANLDAVAMYSVNASKSQDIFQGHLNAKKTGSNIGLLTDEALQNTEMTEFDAALASGMMKDFKVYTNPKTGHVEMGFTNLNGETKFRDIWAANEAFKTTGQNLASYVITKEDNVTGGNYAKALEAELKDFKDLVPVVSQKTKFDPGTNTEKTITTSGVVNYEENLMKNHKDFLLQKTKAPNFNKTWTQLQNLGYIEDEFKDIPWSTFTQGDRSVDGSVEQAIKNLKLTAEQTALVDTDKPGEKGYGVIDEKEYLAYQDKFREQGARGIAKLSNKMFGQPVETVTSEKEIINKYKTNKGDGTFTVTRTNADSFYRNYTNKYLPVANAIKKLEGEAEFNLLKFYNTPVAKDALKEQYNYNPTKQKISTAEEIKQAFNKLNAGKKVTDNDYIELPTEISEYPDGIFIANADITDQFEGGFELIANAEFIEMKDGKLTDEGRRNLSSTLNVDNSLFDDANNPSYISQVNQRLKQSNRQIKPALK
tara:strand:- start:2923 stop:4716 length:1794 start_codon:yes stop_codon:yes gene_type:complete